MRQIHAAAAAALALSALPFAAAAATTTYAFNLTPDQEVPAAASSGAGSFELVLDDVANTLSFVAIAFNLSGTPTASHIHMAPAGSNGPVSFDLLLNADASGPVEVGAISIPNSFAMAGSNVGVSASLISDINAAPWDYYVNLHTTAVPSGELRGQLAVAPIPEPGTYALMALGLLAVGASAHRASATRGPAKAS